MTDDQRITSALALAHHYGQIDGAHHKTWVIDQMVRTLTGEIVEHAPYDRPTTYGQFVQRHNAGDDGPNTYEWDEGRAP